MRQATVRMSEEATVFFLLHGVQIGSASYPMATADSFSDDKVDGA
jgi:hypothetical protein